MKLNKKVAAVLLSVMLSIPILTGCSNSEVHIKLFGKEVYSREKDNKEIKDRIEGYDKQTPSSKHTADEAVEAIVTGGYSIRYNGQEYTVEMETILETLFPNCEIYTQFVDENTCLVKFQSGDNYIVYRLSFLTGTLVEQELCYNGTILTETDDGAHYGLLNLVVAEIINKDEVKEEKKEEKSLVCKHCGKSYKKSKSDASEPDKYCSSGCYTEARMLEKKKKEEEAEKKEEKTCKCKRCGKKYNPKDSNSWENETYCSKECQVNYEQEQEAIAKNKEREEARQNSKYHCAVCDKPYFPNESGASDPYSFCCPECENHYNQDPNNTASNDYIDNSACKNCGKEIGLNGYMGYCYDCHEKLGIGR